MQLTVGAMADSYYEYLLKTWLVTDKQDPLYLDMWIRAMDEMLDKLLFSTPSGDMMYLGEIKHTMYVRMCHVLSSLHKCPCISHHCIHHVSPVPGAALVQMPVALLLVILAMLPAWRSCRALCRATWHWES